jgi:hypothetical protein
MVNKLRKEADNIGLTKQRLTQIYARARHIRMTFTKYIPDTTDAIRDYVNLLDSTFKQDRSGGGRNNSFYYLSTVANIYVEVFDKAAGFAVTNPDNHAMQINIYSNNDEHVRGMAKAVNGIFEDGMLAHLDWKKIEGKFKIKSEDCIKVWNALLQ